MPAREINPFTALTRIRSQFLRTQWSTSNHQRVNTTTPQTTQPSGLARSCWDILICSMQSFICSISRRSRDSWMDGGTTPGVAAYVGDGGAWVGECPSGIWSLSSLLFCSSIKTFTSNSNSSESGKLSKTKYPMNMHRTNYLLSINNNYYISDVRISTSIGVEIPPKGPFIFLGVCCLIHIAGVCATTSLTFVAFVIIATSSSAILTPVVRPAVCHSTGWPSLA